MTAHHRSGNEPGEHPELAWHRPDLASDQELLLRSSDFENEGVIPRVHAARRAGGQNLSPALTWSPAPDGTAQLLLIVEDPDAPTSLPFLHCVALLDPALTAVPQGALDGDTPAAGVRTLRSSAGRGYLGPAPPKSHGPHRYVFQLFALGTPLATGLTDAALDAARPRQVLDAARGVLARGLLSGFYQRS